MRTKTSPAAASSALITLVVVGISVAALAGSPTGSVAQGPVEARPGSGPTPGPGETAVWLSDLDWIDASNGWGPVEKDTSNGEDGAGDGNPITLNGEVYAKGLGVAAPSNVTYALEGYGCTRLLATVGIDDEVDHYGTGGSVVFQVLADGKKIFDSGVRYGVQWSDSVLKTTTGSLNVDLHISGAKSLELRTDPWYDGISNDHADWAAARIFCQDAPTPPPYVIVDADPAEPVMLPQEPTTVVFGLRNNTDEAVTLPVSTETPEGYTASAPSQAEIPANSDAELPVTLTRTTSSLADAEFRLIVGDQSMTVPLHPTDNWVRIADMSASSTYAPPSSPENVNDGDIDDEDWGSGGADGWNDGTAGAFPDTVTATWSHPVKLSRVKVYTLDSSRYPASKYGVRDYDLLALVNGNWVTVAEVRGNQVGMVESSFAEVSAEQLRVKILASNDGAYSRLVELEAYSN